MLIRVLCPLFVALSLVAVACTQEEPLPPAAPSPTPRDATPSRTPTVSPTSSQDDRDEPFDPNAVELSTRVVARGFEAPVGLAHAGDGSGLMYVVEQFGRISYFSRSAPRPTPFLDISDRILAGGEQGLLGLAFHPNYDRNGRFFVNYTDVNGDTVVSEFRARERVADPGSERALLTVDQPFSNHNGGDLAFGPDGYLYIALGDGGSAGDPENNGQNVGALLGKLLRIDVDEREAGPYGIPPDNPFVDEGDARPEIWAYGLRNPWQFSFDRETQDLWIADVGQGALEEVNREPANASGGRNYGWRVVEGDRCYEDGCDPNDFTAPVITYSHDQGCAVTGGYVYRGERFASLRGAYLAGDYCSGNIWALPANVTNASDPSPTLETDFGITSFGEDEEGELYLTDANSGTIRTLEGRPRN